VETEFSESIEHLSVIFVIDLVINPKAMKNLINIVLIVFILVLSNSCNKGNDVTPVSVRDGFVGTYSGTLTYMVTSNGEIIDYHETPETKIIEKGFSENDLIIGKGTDFELNATIDGTKFIIPGQIKHLTTGAGGLEFNISILGQGILGKNNELTISISGTEEFDKSFYKWTIIDRLKKD
jgi:hypothetical protein